MASSFTIHQGDTGPVFEVRPSVLGSAEVIDATWHCYVAAIDANGKQVITSREVTDKTSDNLRWIVALAPSETIDLTPNESYYMVIQVVNDTTNPIFNVEKHYQINVNMQGIE